MLYTTIVLKKTIIYIDGRHQKMGFDNIYELKGEPIGPGGSDSWNKVLIKVSDLPPSNFGGSCKIIKRQYSLILTVTPSAG